MKMENSQTEPYIMKTVTENETMRITISIEDEDYKFEVWPENGEAVVSFEECLSWRGNIQVSDPHESIYRKIIQSDEMTTYLEKRNLEGATRLRPGPA